MSITRSRIREIIIEAICDHMGFDMPIEDDEVLRTEFQCEASDILEKIDDALRKECAIELLFFNPDKAADVNTVGELITFVAAALENHDVDVQHS